MRPTTTNWVHIAALALRNVGRNRRRTMLNVSALVVGMGILILALAWIEGYHTYIYATIRDFQTGELQVLDTQWYQDRSRLPVDRNVPNYRELRDTVSRVVAPYNGTVSGRVLFSARVSAGPQSWPSAVTAIDPQAESAVGVLDAHVVEGETPKGGQRGAWIGRDLAQRANVVPGDALFLRAVNRHGVENLYDVPVRGVFHYGFPALDDQMLYVDLETADELLDLDGSITHLIARIPDQDNIEPAAEDIAAVIPRDAEVRPWQDFARAAVTGVEQDTISFLIMVGILYVLIVLGIVNSMSMSVHERTREIGTIRSIGMRRRPLLLLFAFESVWQALIAAAISLAVTAPLVWWLSSVGVDIASSVPEGIPIPFAERFRADIQLNHYVITVLSGIGTAVVGAFLPARRAARLSVADAMRSRG